METLPKLTLNLSAPGKVILFGEHSVVHNKTAVAATLGLRTKLQFTETFTGSIRLRFPSVQFEGSFPVDSVLEHFSFRKNEEWNEYLKQLIENFGRFCSKNEVKELNNGQRFSLITFFHCFSGLTSSCTGFDVIIDSDLAVGSGVGSSASFSVAISTARLLYKSIKESGTCAGLIKRQEGSIEIDSNLKTSISELSHSCEKILHGNPSGIDGNTILHGSMLEFVRTETGNTMKRIEGGIVRVLLVNTNVSRSTKKLVEDVKELKSRHPEVIGEVLEAMNKVSKSAIETIKDLKEKSVELKKSELKLSELINLNHRLLRVLDVSHDSLEKICTISKKHGLSAKLTGAGGGGYAFVYIPSTVTPEVIDDVKQELIDSNFTVTLVTLGGPGLTIEELVYE